MSIAESLEKSLQATRESIEDKDPSDIDILDSSAEINLNGDIMEITLVTTCGGPLIEVHLPDATIEGIWGKTARIIHFDKDKADRLWDFYSEIYRTRLIE